MFEFLQSLWPPRRNIVMLMSLLYIIRWAANPLHNLAVSHFCVCNIYHVREYHISAIMITVTIIISVIIKNNHITYSHFHIHIKHLRCDCGRRFCCEAPSRAAGNSGLAPRGLAVDPRTGSIFVSCTTSHR